MLKDMKVQGQLEKVEAAYSSTDRPWMFLVKAASILTKGKFFVEKGEVSKKQLKTSYFMKQTFFLTTVNVQVHFGH